MRITKVGHSQRMPDFAPVVPSKRNRKEPWDYDRELYKQRNGIERFFRRLKTFRRICSRYDKFDTMFSAFIHLAIINMTLRRVNTP